IAVALFIVLSFAYFYPALEGKVLKANDSTVSTINSKEIRDFRAKFHKEPLWTNSIFSGMPAYLISTRYPGNLFKYVDTCLRVFQTPVSVLLLSMAGFYLLLLLFGLSPWLSFAGAIAYGFSSFLFQILAAGHNTQAIAFAYMAPMIGGVYYAYRHNAVKGALLAGFMLTLELIANHPQITYYSFLCLLVFVITEFIYAIKQKALRKFIRTSAILIVPVVLAVGINFGNLYTVYEYGKYSIRGKSDLTQPGQKVARGLDKDYITYWSYGVGETMNLLIPNFKGGSSQPFNPDSRTVRALRANNAGNYVNSVLKYWGSQPGTDGPHYVGAIVIFLFILGLVIVKGPVKWWLLVATVLSVILAWGKNFMPLTNLFIDYFPGYNKFRAVTMILVISQFCIPLLGFLALKDIYDGKLNRKEIMKGFKIALGVSGGITLLVLLIPGIAGSFLTPNESQFPDWLKTALVADRKDLLRSDGFRSLLFILTGAGAILGFIYGKLRKEYSIALLAFLILVDLWTVDKRYLNAGKFESQSVFRKTFTPSVADEAILKDTTDYRVLNLSVSTFNDNSPTSYFFKSIGGYHGAKLERYQELIDSAIIPDLYRFAAAEKGAKSIEDFNPVFRNTPVLNMLDAKYVIYNPDAPPLVNTYALGNVWFVEKPVFADNANTELAEVNKIDLSKEAVIDKKYSDQVTAPAYPLAQGDTIHLIKYEPNELTYRYKAGGDRLAIFSEIYYPAGWKCYIDGKESKYFRADYVLRAMIVPGGTHEIKFVFRPRSYIVGNKVSLASSVLFFVLIAGYIAAQFMRKPKAENGTL
ncbi:MAG: YfhO family protein, partial [Bacteroidales bacterium]